MRSPTADAMPELEAFGLASPATASFFSPLILIVFIACVAGAAALLNCALMTILIQRARNGLFLLIIQLTVADLMLLSISAGPELWTTNAKTWYFGRGTCIAFRGIRVFASTASLYLVVTIALHTLATINLEEKLLAQRSKRSTIVDDEEMRSSCHSLVTSSDTSTPPRTMQVDYHLGERKIPVTPPTLFIWILSASLSIPEFTLATTVRIDHDIIVCTLVDSSHRFNIHSLLSLFNFFLPTLIMTMAAILVAFKLNSNKLKRNGFKESVPALRLSISLIIVYFFMCAPRSLLYVYNTYSMDIYDNEKVEKQNEDQLIGIINLICSSLYLVATLLRPMLCIVILPRIRKKFTFGLERALVNDV